MSRFAANALLALALLLCAAAAAGIPDRAGRPADFAAPSPDSTAQSLEAVKERPVYDPDIYDEDTTVYASSILKVPLADRGSEAPIG